MKENLINSDFLEKYKEDVALILKYNPIEYEMYSFISDIIRNTVDISLRDVHKCDKRSKYTTKFYCKKGTPDFAIMSRNINDEKVYGSVEVKMPTATYTQGKLNYWENIEQFEAQLEKFKNVIYTDGIEWRFYNYMKYATTGEPNKTFNLGKIADDYYIDWNKSNDEWINLLTYIEKFIQGILE